MKSDYTHISDKLQYLLFNYLGNKYLINPFFRISKTTPEQTKKYKFLIKNNWAIFSVIFSLIMLIINFFKILSFIVVSIFMSYQYFYLSKATKDTDIAFLSHAIGANININKNDQFFASMPNYLEKKGKKITIIYTNHNKFRYSKNNKILTFKDPEINVILMPKFLRPHENFKFICIALTFSIRCLSLGISKLFSSPLDGKILIKAAACFFDRDTYNNYLLKTRFQEFQQKSNAKYFVFTFEGHSYEQYVTDELLDFNPQCKFIFYQHSPVVIGHVGIKNFLQQCTNPVDILVTGKVYKDHLQKLSTVPEYKVLGSQKFVPETTIVNKSENLTLLFAPEGTPSATIEFLKLINDLIKTETNKIYILRLHPNLSSNLKIYFLVKKLRKYHNFYISKTDLASDLEKSQFVFYRSSAVGVESLLSRAIPVFYANSNEIDLNPLSLVSNITKIVFNSTEVANLLKIQIKEIDPLGKKIMFEGLFSEIDYSVLDNLFTHE